MKSLEGISLPLQQRHFFRGKIRNLGLGLTLAMLSGGCGRIRSLVSESPDSGETAESIISRYTDAGRDSARGVPLPPQGGTTDADADAVPDVVTGAAPDAVTDAAPDAATADAAPDAAAAADAAPDATDAVTITTPQDQGSSAFIAERDRCYRELPSHACLYDGSTTDASGRVTRESHTIQLSPDISRENHVYPNDTEPTNDLACELLNTAGRRTFEMVIQHDGAYYTCNYRDRTATDLTFHRLVACTKHPITARTPNPCVRR